MVCFENIRLGRNGFPDYKHSSLFCNSVSDEEFGGGVAKLPTGVNLMRKNKLESLIVGVTKID
jgi:hypothetical protein